MGRQGGDCKGVGLVKGTGVEEAFGVIEGYEYGGHRSLISLGQMLRKVLQEVDFVGDLELVEIWSMTARRVTESRCVR